MTPNDNSAAPPDPAAVADAPSDPVQLQAAMAAMEAAERAVADAVAGMADKAEPAAP